MGSGCSRYEGGEQINCSLKQNDLVDSVRAAAWVGGWNHGLALFSASDRSSKGHEYHCNHFARTSANRVPIFYDRLRFTTKLLVRNSEIL